MRDKSTAEYIPPGFRRLSDLSNEVGAVKLRDQLATGAITAFLLRTNLGLLKAIPKEDWISESGELLIERGYGEDVHTIIGPDRTHPLVPIVVQEAGSAVNVAERTEYIPPFIKVMFDAVAHFDISPNNPAPVHKKLEAFFLGRSLPDGQKISMNQARMMATFCRTPEQMKGGLVRRRG